MGITTQGASSFLARLYQAPPTESDADLLERFVQTTDETAFTALVRRHGPMVLAVCRRALGHEADAEDAFQAVFLALANTAKAIRRRESLSGWLYRVAHQISLKAAGRRARQPRLAILGTEVPMPDTTPAWESNEQTAIVNEEIAALPDKFRAVVVLCLIEGRTNAEAAAVLGVPVGTIDSRLNSARKKLQDRLTRRGVAVGVGIALEQLLGGPIEAASPPALDLFSRTVSAVLIEAIKPGCGAVSHSVAELSRGITVAATTKLRAIVSLGMVVGLLGGTGAGLYFATAADPVKPAAKTSSQQIAVAKPAPIAVAVAANDEANADKPKPSAATLLRPIGPGLKPEGTKLEELFKRVEEQTGLVVRVDVAAFRRLVHFGTDDEESPQALLKQIYNTEAVLPRQVDKLSIRDTLTDALAQVRGTFPCTYQVRGHQLVIVPAYVPAYLPGVNPLDPGDKDPHEPQHTIHEQIYGGVVNVAAEDTPLAEVLADLRKQTGANIVLDRRCQAQKQPSITIELDDVRLYDALTVIADMAELKMVYTGNMYYVTTKENAKTFQPPTPNTAPPVPAPPAPAKGN